MILDASLSYLPHHPDHQKSCLVSSTSKIILSFILYSPSPCSLPGRRPPSALAWPRAGTSNGLPDSVLVLLHPNRQCFLLTMCHLSTAQVTGLSDACSKQAKRFPASRPLHILIHLLGMPFFFLLKIIAIINFCPTVESK